MLEKLTELLSRWLNFKTLLRSSIILSVLLLTLLMLSPLVGCAGGGLTSDSERIGRGSLEVVQAAQGEIVQETDAGTSPNAEGGDSDSTANREPNNRRRWNIDDYTDYRLNLEKAVGEARKRCAPEDVKNVIVSLANIEFEQKDFFATGYSKYQFLFIPIVPLYKSCRKQVRRVIDENLSGDDLFNYKENLCSWLREDAEGQDDAPGGRAWQDSWCGK